MFTEKDHRYMRLALEQAQLAFDKNEVPVGAVLVPDDSSLKTFTTHNLKEEFSDPTSHAELNIVREASRELKCWRLQDYTLYVTLEPCFMCAGALVHARIRRLVIGCLDPKAGAVVSLAQVCNDSRLNHQIEIEHGLLEKECGDLLRKFFKLRRR